jgi:hypothetical protein
VSRTARLLLTSSLFLLGGCNKPAADQQSAATSQATPTSQINVNATVNTNATPTATATPASAQTSAAKGEVDPCSLLTSGEIKGAQGEAVSEAKSNRQASGGLVSLQCFYTLPTSSNSVSLTLTETDPSEPGGRTAKQYWRETFKEGKAGGEEREGEARAEKEKAQTQKQAGGREEEEGGSPPEPVRDLGDEAFWIASRFGGALYVLKGDKFIRVSIGGQGDAESKLTKSKALARDALRRL